MFWIMMIVEVLIAFFIGTVCFDIVHYSFHKCLKSKNKWLRSIASWHNAHHRFFSSSLMIQLEFSRLNLVHHAAIEYAVQVIGTFFCYLFLQPIAITFAILIETLLFINVWLSNGRDLHHRSYTILPSYRGGPFVTADYHALHHIYPNYFFSSYIKFFDYIFGTSLPLVGKHIAMTGASGALGSQMKKLLEKEGAIVTTLKFGVDYTYQQYDQLQVPLSQADILFLCHGSKYDFAQQANCDSYIRIIELYKSAKITKLVPPEIWAVGSEIECHPCFGIKKIQIYAKSKRNYAKAGRYYFHQRDIQYRHLVHSAFISSMGPGLMSAKFAAMVTLMLLKRGFKYIPVTYTGFAYLNYFRFLIAKFRLNRTSPTYFRR